MIRFVVIFFFLINLFSSEKNDSRDAIDGIAILNEVRVCLEHIFHCQDNVT